MTTTSDNQSTRLSVLIVDDEANIRKTLAVCLESRGHRVTAVSNAQDARVEADRLVFDVAFVDLRLGTENGLDLIPTLLGACPWIKIVVITACASVDTAVEAMRRGATDYIPKPFTPEQVGLVAARVAAVRSRDGTAPGFNCTAYTAYSAGRPYLLGSDQGEPYPSRHRLCQVPPRGSRRSRHRSSTVSLIKKSGTWQVRLSPSFRSTTDSLLTLAIRYLPPQRVQRSGSHDDKKQAANRRCRSRDGDATPSDRLGKRPQVEVVAICTRHVENARRRVREFAIPEAYADVAETLDREKP